MERPNLKICIENEGDSDSDNDNPIIEDFDIDEDTRESEEDDKSGADDRESVKSETETEATLDVSLDDQKLSIQEPRRYKNKEGEFITGFDPLSEEAQEQKKKRAQRFGIKEPVKTVSEEHIKDLYKSLGITEQDLQNGERGIRLEAVHIRGLDHMSTKDVFAYFQGYSPGSIEWIDDASCNAVWFEPITAARALINLSNSMLDNEDTETKTVKKKTSEEVKSTEEMKADEGGDEDEKEKDKDVGQLECGENVVEKLADEGKGETDSTVNKSSEQSSEAGDKQASDNMDVDNDAKDSEAAEKMPEPDAIKKSGKKDDDFDYDLNLMSDEENDDQEKETKDDKAVGETDAETGEREHTPAGSSQGESVESGECTDDGSGQENSDKDEEMDTDDIKNTKPFRRKKAFPKPPGMWRIGGPYPQTTNENVYVKSEVIYMRYAFKADQKVAGAERRSKYYQKFGNPNYGGMRGLISTSKKNRIRAAKFQKEEEEAKKMVAKTKKFTGIPKETAFDLHTEAAQEKRFKEQTLVPDARSLLTAKATEKAERQQVNYGSDYSGDDGSDDRGDDRSYDRSDDRNDDRSDDPDDVDEELRLLLGEAAPEAPVPAKKRIRRMYADDIEEELRAKRSSGFAASNIKERMADARDRLGDARQLIKGRKADSVQDDYTSASGGDLRNRLGRKRGYEEEICGSKGLAYLPSLTIEVEPD